MRIARCILPAFILVAGCAPSNPGPAQPVMRTSVISSTDQCAMLLHDMEGAILLYHAANHRLPEKLEDLRRVGGAGASLEFACPVSGKPYIYDPIGLSIPPDKARAIVYDAAPSHTGMRYGISIIEPGNGGPLITKVITIPESRFEKEKK